MNEGYNIVYAKSGGRPNNIFLETRLSVYEFIIENYNKYDLFSVNDLIISQNRIKDLGDIPDSVIRLDCSNNFITEIPENILIKSYSNEDDLVLDNFAGIGSTLIACKNTNRKCIGIEIDKKYCDIYFEQCK